MGPDPLTLDPWREDQFVPLGAWRDKSGLTLTATTEPDLIVMGTSFYGMKWDHGGTTTDIARLNFIMPMHFAEAEGLPQYDIKLICVARKLDPSATGSDENTNLCLESQLNWFSPAILNDQRGRLVTDTAPTISTAATASKSLTTPARALLATATLAADNTGVAGFARYELDLGARIRAEGKALYAGDVCSLALYPHEAVGGTDMDLEVLPPVLRIRRVQDGIVARAAAERCW